MKPSTYPWIISSLLMLGLPGCSTERAESTAQFEPNLVHTTKYQIQKDLPMDQAARDATWVVTKMFGTPDEPRVPAVVSADEDLAAVVSMEKLIRASGPSDEEGRGLYRKHCAVCHGVTGNGRGPTAAVQVPYPRDYRMGIFKFKSTPRGSKPTREDLVRLITGGIPGTAMIKIPALTDDDVAALVDYVIYLSWRGELERRIIDDAMFELDLAGGERILNTELASELDANPERADKLAAVLEDVDGEQLSQYEDYLEFEKRLAADPDLRSKLKGAAKNHDALADDLERFEAHQEFAEELAEDTELAANLAAALKVASGRDLIEFETYAESWEITQDFAVEIAESWLDADEEVIDVPEPPENFPLASSYADVIQFRDGDRAAEFEASVKRGQELFVGKIASCSKCHGETGLGDGQTTDYDDWTKDWTSRVGLKPEDRDAIIPLLARGALPPKNAIPRNFAEGVFRGGGDSNQLYRRITQGIDGTPMPAVTFVEGEFEPKDIWHIINFIRSLQTSESTDSQSSDSTAQEEPA